MQNLLGKFFIKILEYNPIIRSSRLEMIANSIMNKFGSKRS